MIVGHLTHWNNEKHLYAPGIQKAIAWLQTHNLETLPTGRQEIDGDKLYGLVNEYVSEPKTKRRAEAHRKYVDVQYIVKGTESIGYARLQDGYEVLEDKLAEKDVIFYKNPLNESDIVLSEGMFGIFFPWDVHRPNCAVGEPGPIRKVILKISMDSLK
jgi:YhcH/YjgK/YiaL family protein